MSIPTTQTPLPRPPSQPDWWASFDDLPADLVTKDPQKAADALSYASFVVSSLAGRMHAPVQTTTELYDTRSILAAGSEVYPVFFNGQPFNCCGGPTSCCCNQCGIFHRTRLSRYPVQDIQCVWADGIQLPRSSYVLLDNAVLGLLRGVCEVGCLLVTYCFGTGIPAGGRMAVVRLATELLSFALGGPCKLPSRVTQVSRQGVSWTLLDPQDFLKDGRTGLYEIDLFLSAINPAGSLRRPKVFSPDIPRGERIQQMVPNAPLPIVLSADAATVASWRPERVIITHRDVVAAAKSRATLTTELLDVGAVGHNFLMTGTWIPSADGNSAILNLTDAERSYVAGAGIRYQVTQTSTAGVSRVIAEGYVTLV